jgi:hypothetical protein
MAHITLFVRECVGLLALMGMAPGSAKAEGTGLAYIRAAPEVARKIADFLSKPTEFDASRRVGSDMCPGNTPTFPALNSRTKLGGELNEGRR